MSTTDETVVVDTPHDDDEYVIDFNGPDDPELAVNWPASRKWVNVFVLAVMTFIV